MKPFVLMVTFLTRIPVKINFEIKDADFRRGIWYMPVIGLLIGALLYAVNLLIGRYISPLVNSLAIVSLYTIITGGLHIDGLADTADAVFSCRDKDRMLEIMKDSRIGTFGVIGIILYISGMLILLSEVPQACFLFPLSGRGGAVLSCAMSGYARQSGLGKTIVEGTRARHVIFSVVLSLGAMLALYLVTKDALSAIISAAALTASLICVVVITRSISKKLSGITGDVVGFIIEVSSVLFVAFHYVGTIIAGII